MIPQVGSQWLHQPKELDRVDTSRRPHRRSDHPGALLWYRTITANSLPTWFFERHAASTSPPVRAETRLDPSSWGYGSLWIVSEGGLEHVFVACLHRAGIHATDHSCMRWCCASRS
jgi:hypothetical protein